MLMMLPPHDLQATLKNAFMGSCLWNSHTRRVWCPLLPPRNKSVRCVIYAWNMKKKKKEYDKTLTCFFKIKRLWSRKKIKIQHYNFSVACYFNSQNGMLFIASHSVWQKTQNHFPFERNWKYISRAFRANVRNITLKINIISWKKRRQSKKINKKKINRVIRVGWMVFLKNVWKWKC